MFYVGYGRFKELKGKIWSDWLSNEENVKKFQNALPKGARFVGAYMIVAGAEHDYEIWYEIDNWGVLDTWRDHEPWGKLVEELAKESGFLWKWGNVKFLRAVNNMKWIVDPVTWKQD